MKNQSCSKAPVRMRSRASGVARSMKVGVRHSSFAADRSPIRRDVFLYADVPIYDTSLNCGQRSKIEDDWKSVSHTLLTSHLSPLTQACHLPAPRLSGEHPDPPRTDATHTRRRPTG